MEIISVTWLVSMLLKLIVFKFFHPENNLLPVLKYILLTLATYKTYLLLSLERGSNHPRTLIVALSVKSALILALLYLVFIFCSVSLIKLTSTMFSF